MTTTPQQGNVIRARNGAEASSILRLFSKDIFWISLLTVFLEAGSLYIGGVSDRAVCGGSVIASGGPRLLHALYYCSSSVV